MEKKTIFIFDAEPGMILASDVIAQDGSLIVANGTKLDMDSIAKLSDYHILEIDVEDRPVEPEQEEYVGIEEIFTSSAPAEEPTYYDKIRETAEFKEFCEDYELDVNELKNSLNDIVKRNSPVNEAELLAHTMSIVDKHNNTLQLFDMLHSLRQFDDQTFAHSINVALISSIIGQWLHFSREDIKVLTLSGLLHDIGKLDIPDEVLNKPGKLTPEEFATIKSHVKIGYEYLKNQQIDNRIKEACLMHHEKCDGSGYPFGVKSDKIPVFAKIISIADVYDAMTAARVYRKGLCPFKVIREMENQCFTSLDPNYAIPFLRNVISSYIHTNVTLSDGRIGEVVLINDRALSKPSVICNGEFIDLSKTSLTIESIL